MYIRITDNTVEIEGYVNAVERLSKPLPSRRGDFLERIRKGAFERALKRNDDVRFLLNHNWNRDLGGTKDGNVELTEDNIGLHIRATISDAEAVQKAKRGELIGFSFGFEDRDVDEQSENGMMTRNVNDLDLYEISVLDRTKTPAYDGTLINVRDSEGEQAKKIYFGETFADEINIKNDAKTEVREKSEEKPIDYSEAEKIISEMKGEN
ncbi:MAG: HK97 family phage prohead protease [Methanobrevibacter sp.]|nr:HK97 family phage prohead protease [Methanobrevibacter sp.]